MEPEEEAARLGLGGLTGTLTGEQAECDQEWTGEPEKSEF